MLHWQKFNVVIIGFKKYGSMFSFINLMSKVRSPCRSFGVWNSRIFFPVYEDKVDGRSTLKIHQFRHKHSEIDMSKVPVLNEEDIEEWYTKGSGPGGSNVNKRTNACALRHKQTGILVKCHLSRLLDKNRRLAREMMIEKLDIHYNGENSVPAQRERLLQKKLQTNEVRSQKVRELKMKYKDMVRNKDDDNDSSNSNRTS